MELQTLCERKFEKEKTFHRFWLGFANILLALGGGLFILAVSSLMISNGVLTPSQMMAVSGFFVGGVSFMLTYLAMVTFKKEPRYERSSNCSCRFCGPGNGRGRSDGSVH